MTNPLYPPVGLAPTAVRVLENIARDVVKPRLPTKTTLIATTAAVAGIILNNMPIISSLSTPCFMLSLGAVAIKYAGKEELVDAAVEKIRSTSKKIKQGEALQ